MIENILKTLNRAVKLQQSMTDPCIFYKVKNKQVVLILAMYVVDDTLCLGHKEELEWLYKEMQKKF
jgi:hypothetical protein